MLLKCSLNILLLLLDWMSTVPTFSNTHCSFLWEDHTSFPHCWQAWPGKSLGQEDIPSDRSDVCDFQKEAAPARMSYNSFSSAMWLEICVLESRQYGHSQATCHKTTTAEGHGGGGGEGGPFVATERLTYPD